MQIDPMYRECIVPECTGCEKIETMKWYVTQGPVRVCGVYLKPEYWWKRDGCPIRHKYVEVVKKGRAGQQKQKKG